MSESPFIEAGAAVPPINAAALHTDEFFTGMWTQGNPLGSGAVPFLQQKFYSASRFDRLIGGKNTEITTRLTLARRPGNSVYNAGPFPPINRFYEFRAFEGNTESIHILASVDAGTTGPVPASVRDVTGPATNKTLWNKDAAAGRTAFQSVGNICYFADSVDRKKWVLSQLSWNPNTQYNQGDFIVDSNGNLQEAVGAQTANVSNILVEPWTAPGPPTRKVTLFFDPTTPLKLPNGVTLTLAGLTTVPSLNGGSAGIAVTNSLQVSFISVVFAGNPPLTPFSAETGTVSTGTGISGAVQPVWNFGAGNKTQDGGLQWICKGSAVENWGIATPATAPTVTQVPAPSVYPAWQASTWYAPGAFVIIDSNGNVQKLTVAGTTGGGAPAWSAIVGGVTVDNTASWTCLGPPGWHAATVVAVGAIVVVTFTYYITTGQSIPYPPYFILTQTAVTVTNAFECTTAGTTGSNQPDWGNGNLTTVNDNTVVWTNIGTAPPWPGAAQALSLAQTIEDSNGNLQQPQRQGKTAAVAPTWQTATGSTTGDGTSQNWLNIGPYSPANTGAWKWAYSGKNSVTGHIGTASPLSFPLTVTQSNQAVIQGAGIPNDEQIDTIVLWRTLQGGSTLLYEDEFPNPAAGAFASSWIYTDTTPDDGLNEFITAPIAQSNNPPLPGFTPQCYYLGRMWGYVKNKLVWSGGPDTLTGSGNEAFPPGNQFTFPSLGVACWPTSIGLICYTNSDVWVVLGQGTTNSPFYVINFQTGVGLANQDALTVNGSTAYGMLTSGQVVSMDPGAGEIEVGFPIGDRFDEEYSTAETYMAWHQGSSADMALYVADGALGWYRMAAVAAPENGNVWSPRALIQGGVKAVASLEIAPGQKRLLLGPSAQDKPILMRDSTVSQDNGVSYDATANIGSIVLAKPGTTVGIQFVVTEETAIAGSSPVSIGLLYDEITGTFSNLVNVSNDPPNLPASKTVTTQRFWAMQNAQPVKCRHLQTLISWKDEPYPNELLTHTIYGRLPEKARK